MNASVELTEHNNKDLNHLQQLSPGRWNRMRLVQSQQTTLNLLCLMLCTPVASNVLEMAGTLFIPPGRGSFLEGYASGGVYAPCVHSHVGWELLSVTCVFVVVLCSCDIFGAHINSFCLMMESDQLPLIITAYKNCQSIIKPHLEKGDMRLSQLTNRLPGNYGTDMSFHQSGTVLVSLWILTSCQAQTQRYTSG